jgi:hypothetical protein
MKKIAGIMASVAALGWGAARADVGAAGDTSGDTSGAGTTVTTPGATVNAPPGSKTTVTAPPATAPTDQAAPPDTSVNPTPTPDTSAGTAAPAPGMPGTEASPAAPSTNVEVTPPPPAEPPPVQPVQPVYGQEAQPYSYAAHQPHFGVALLVGGGGQDFSGNQARAITSPGGFWNARVAIGTRQFVGVEAAYIGTAQGISALGLSNNAVLISNGAEGVIRFNLPIIRGASLMEPFIFGGAGWQRYHVSNTSTSSADIAGSDDIIEVPYGAGFAFAYKGFMADARFTYRSTFDNNLLQTTGGRLDWWSAGGLVGYEF